MGDEKYTGLGGVGLGEARSYHKNTWEFSTGGGPYLTRPLDLWEKKDGQEEASIGVNFLWSPDRKARWQLNMTPPLFRTDSIFKFLAVPIFESNFSFDQFTMGLQALGYADFFPKKWSVRFGGSVGAQGGYRWIKTEENSWFYGGVARLNLEIKW